MKNKYVPTSVGLYVNYLIIGMAILILPQNMDVLAKQWQTNIAGVSVVIAAVGIGRVAVALVSGILSDKLGRKPFAVLGAVIYIAFFVGILLSRSLPMAIFFGVLAGIANSFLDAGTYPALMEMYPKRKSVANVIIKASVSAGQFLLPLMISMIVMNQLWYGWSFVVCTLILVVNAVFLIAFSKFPAKQVASQTTQTAARVQPNKGNVWIDGTLFTLFGFLSQGIFLLVSTWLTKYGQTIIKMGDTSSRALVSYYSVGSITCVLLTIYLSHRGVQDIHFLFAYTLMSFISLLIMYLVPVALVCAIMSFVVGFSAAGGVMQVGLTIMANFFPNGKGTVTGVSSTAGSMSGFVVPLLGAALSANVANVILLDVGMALACFIVSSIIVYRYRMLFKPAKQATKGARADDTPAAMSKNVN